MDIIYWAWRNRSLYLIRERRKPERKFLPSTLFHHFSCLKSVSHSGGHGQKKMKPNPQENVFVDRQSWPILGTGLSLVDVNGIFFFKLSVSDWPLHFISSHHGEGTALSSSPDQQNSVFLFLTAEPQQRRKGLVYLLPGKPAEVRPRQISCQTFWLHLCSSAKEVSGSALHPWGQLAQPRHFLSIKQPPLQNKIANSNLPTGDRAWCMLAPELSLGIVWASTSYDGLARCHGPSDQSQSLSDSRVYLCATVPVCLLALSPCRYAQIHGWTSYLKSLFQPFFAIQFCDAKHRHTHIYMHVTFP